MIIKAITTLLILTSVMYSAYASIPDDPLVGNKRIILIGNKGEQLDIGAVTFTPSNDVISYSLQLDYSGFTDYFLSMKEMKCLEGPELWCHLAYPYTQPHTVTATDFRWLAHDLLFMFKKKGEFGANFWNGIYYDIRIEDGILKGVAQAVDLNELAAPPDDLNIPPFDEFDRTDIETAPRFLPFVEIR